MQIDAVFLHYYVQFFETFPGAGSKYTFTAIDKKSRVVNRALNQRSIGVEKLVFHPIERCASMWAGISIGKIGTVIFDDKTFDCVAIVFDTKTTRARIR